MAAQAAKRINKVGFLVAMQEEAAPFIGALKPVSYTHLTLPTILLV